MDDARDRPTGPSSDGDPVLQALAADLAREDPRLAALLDGTTPAPRRRRARILLVLLALLVAPLVVLGLLQAPTVTIGAVGMLLVLAAPLEACWLCANDRPAPGPR